MTDKALCTPKARAKRIRAIRQALRYSRRAFREEHGISVGSLQNWEDARFNGLTEKGARRLVKAFRKDGIHCTVEWLLYAIGNNPIPTSHPLLKKQASSPYQTDNYCITEELQLFYQLHPHATHYIIPNNQMAPIYYQGDYIAGKQIFAEDIQKTVGLNCITQTTTGETAIHYIAKHLTGTEFLATTTPLNNSADSQMSHIVLFSAAPIIWIRRKQPI